MTSRAALLCLLIAFPSSADILVLVDGSEIHTRGPWTIEGRRLIYEGETGIRSVIRLENVDLEASRLATEAASKPSEPVLESEPRAGTLWDEAPALVLDDEGPSPAKAASRGRLRAMGQPGAGSLTITSPENQSVYAPGETVVVVARHSSGLDLAELVVVMPMTAEGVKDTMELEIAIPEELVGPIELLASGKTSGGLIMMAEPITLIVEPRSPVEAVRIEPQRPVLRGVGATLELRAYGTYADGVTRDISDPRTGTEYRTSNESVVEVSGSTITARSLGAATIVGRHGDVHDSVTVEVRDEQ